MLATQARRSAPLAGGEREEVTDVGHAAPDETVAKWPGRPKRPVAHRPPVAAKAEEDEAFLQLTGLMPLAAACEHVGVAPATLRRHLAHGECNGRRIGQKWYVSGETIERWARRHPAHGTRGPIDRIGEPACPCHECGQPLGRATAAAQLGARVPRVRALGRMRDAQQQIALDLLGALGAPGRAVGCASWLAAVADEAATEAAQAALQALLASLARRLSAAPADVLGRPDDGALRNAIELT